MKQSEAILQQRHPKGHVVVRPSIIQAFAIVRHREVSFSAKLNELTYLCVHGIDESFRRVLQASEGESGRYLDQVFVVN